jgi:hypothetical protein
LKPSFVRTNMALLYGISGTHPGQPTESYTLSCSIRSSVPILCISWWCRERGHNPGVLRAADECRAALVLTAADLAAMRPPAIEILLRNCSSVRLNHDDADPGDGGSGSLCRFFDLFEYPFGRRWLISCTRQISIEIAQDEFR